MPLDQLPTREIPCTKRMMINISGMWHSFDFKVILVALVIVEYNFEPNFILFYVNSMYILRVLIHILKFS